MRQNAIQYFDTLTLGQSDIISPFVSLFETTCNKNKSKENTTLISAHFSSSTTDNLISIQEYLARIIKYAGYDQCTEETLTCTAIYLFRIEETGTHLRLSTFHRLFITAFCLANKFLRDKHFSNKFDAQLGGISLSEFNELELDFAFEICFSFYVSLAEYQTAARAVDIHRRYLLSFFPPQSNLPALDNSLAGEKDTDEKSSSTDDLSQPPPYSSLHP